MSESICTEVNVLTHDMHIYALPWHTHIVTAGPETSRIINLFICSVYLMWVGDQMQMHTVCSFLANEIKTNKKVMITTYESYPVYIMFFYTCILIQPLVFHQSQLFKYHKDPRSETKFAFYTTMVDGEGETKVYYLKPESGVIVAEESSTPDGYLWSLLIAIATEERAETMQACRQLLTIGSAILWGHKWSICGPNPLSPRENQEYSPTEDCAYYWIDSESVW